MKRPRDCAGAAGVASGPGRARVTEAPTRTATRQKCRSGCWVSQDVPAIGARAWCPGVHLCLTLNAWGLKYTASESPSLTACRGTGFLPHRDLDPLAPHLSLPLWASGEAADQPAASQSGPWGLGKGTTPTLGAAEKVIPLLDRNQ